jgi:hypothetical protein
MFLKIAYFMILTNSTELRSFLRSLQSLSYLRVPTNFMEPEGSLQCSQQSNHWSLTNQVLTTPSYFSKILLSIIFHLRLGLCSCLCPSGLLAATTYEFFSPPLHDTCAVVLIPRCLIILFGKGYKTVMSSRKMNSSNDVRVFI